LLKEKCPWHLDGNHTTEQCYQLRRALKDTPEPRHPHDKKGKKKNDEGNGDFEEPDKTVNILFGGLPSRRVLVEIGPEGGRRHNSPLIVSLPSLLPRSYSHYSIRG
jgi:hypothetical protein